MLESFVYQMEVAARYQESDLLPDHAWQHKVVYGDGSSSASNQEEDDLSVSDGFIKEFNEKIGSMANARAAKVLLEKMRQLGGLDPGLSVNEINIPNARLGLCLLAGLHDYEYKTQALESLQELLQRDDLSKKNAFNLVNLTIKLLDTMDRYQIQNEVIDHQILLAKVYGTVANLLQRHYAKKNLNGITRELKVQLIATAKSLEKLNRQNDPRLSYYVSYALEGIRRLKDDCEVLFDIVERFYHGVASAVAFYLEDPYVGFREACRVFQDLAPGMTHSWYNGVLILTDLHRGARSGDSAKLQQIQLLLDDKYRDLDWKFTYAALEILYDICLNGETEEVRHIAFLGINPNSEPSFDHPLLPAIQNFVACTNQFDPHLSFKPIKYLEKPYIKDPNTLVRQACAEYLFQLIHKSPDPLIQEAAISNWFQRKALETEIAVLEVLQRPL